MKVVKDPELKIERKESLNKMLWNTVQSHPRVSAIGYWDDGKLKYLTYEEFWERVRKLSKFLISSGLRKGDRVAIYADTRYEWEIADFAVLTAGGVVVTVHSVLNREQVEYILRDSESRVVFTEKKYAENVPEDFEVYFLEELESLSVRFLMMNSKADGRALSLTTLQALFTPLAPQESQRGRCSRTGTGGSTATL